LKSLRERSKERRPLKLDATFAASNYAARHPRRPFLPLHCATAIAISLVSQMP